MRNAGRLPCSCTNISSPMPQIRSFPPIVDTRATVLILGSMPGHASLKAAEYYAHPQNAFWKIMRHLLGLKSDATYAERTQALRDAGIGLYDVLRSCQREGSLDSSIDKDSQVANNFPRLFRGNPQISHVFFNGTHAETTFQRLVAPNLRGEPKQFARLPSTSPAHASLSFDQKLEAWRAVMEVS